MLPPDRRPGALALRSMLWEDLLGLPGDAERAAHRAAVREPENAVVHLIDAAVAALVAGRPRQARRVLSDIGDRPEAATLRPHLALLAYWAAELDQNWYPGQTGAERLGPDPMTLPVDADEAAAPGLSPETCFLARWLEAGPVGLLLPRALVGANEQAGERETAVRFANVAAHRVQVLNRIGRTSGNLTLAGWAQLAQCDLAQRTGREAEARAGLDGVLAGATRAGDAVLLALAHFMEGDWWATPGSAPETLGWSLAGQDRPPDPPSARALARAGRCYAAAEEVCAAVDAAAVAPQLWAALHLRGATLAWLRADHPARRSHLRTALVAARAAGAVATEWLLEVHLLLADLAEGAPTERVAAIGSGWGPPSAGLLVELGRWAGTDGSVSWAVGLGRLLQRAGEAWRAAGDDGRATQALSAALPLLELNPAMVTRPLSVAIAAIDARRNLGARALARLERLRHALPPVRDFTSDPFAVVAELQVLTGLVGAQHRRLRTAAGPAAHGLVRVRNRLRHLRRLAPSATAPLVAEIDELARQVDVLLPLAEAERAQALGDAAEADAAYDAALAACRRAAPYLRVLVLIAADRRSQAAAAVAELAESVERADPDRGELGLLVQLALRVGDHARAADAFARSGADPERTVDWAVVLAGAEIASAAGDPGRAARLAERGITLFEASLGLLRRDPDRVAAADLPDAVLLYLTAAAAQLRLAGPEAAFDVVERFRELAIGPLIGQEFAGPDDQRLRRAAAGWSTHVDRLLAKLNTASPSGLDTLLEEVDDAERRLREQEIDFGGRTAGRTRRSTPPAPLRLTALQERLAPGTLVLEYLAGDDELMICAVTRDMVRVLPQPVRRRALTPLVRAFRERCAAGAAGGPEANWLAELLLGPVADLLRADGVDRVVVVPAGSLTAVPIHALPFDGAPLGHRHVMSYAPTAAIGVPPESAAIVTTNRVFVVGDPAFDRCHHPGLRRLRGAHVEAALLAQRLPGSAVRLGPAAGLGDVLPLLADRDVIHLAAHCRLDEQAPYSSALVLAGADELTVADLFGVRLDAQMVVLSGCDTGGGAQTLGGDVVGLTRALLAAGVRWAVVSLWPVDDAVTTVTMAFFYDHLRICPPPTAMALAQRDVFRLDQRGLRDAYLRLRVEAETGRGGADVPTGRRSVSAADDELEVPLAGSDERCWAPFIVVGG